MGMRDTRQRFDEVLFALEDERRRVDEDKTLSSRCRLPEDPAAQASPPRATTTTLHPSALAGFLTYRGSTPPEKEEPEQQPYEGYDHQNSYQAEDEHFHTRER
jgi:hypothetical protein